MKPESVYAAKSKWLRQIMNVEKGVRLMETKGAPRAFSLLALSREIYRVGVRGEEIFDCAFEMDFTPEWLQEIGDYLSFVEELSDRVYLLSERRKIMGCKKYLNLKCPGLRKVVAPDED